MTEVQISKGIITLRKPLAGERNEALMSAETPDGIKTTVFMVKLLPKVIVKHPFGAEPIEKALNSLSVEEYDNLIDALRPLINVSKAKGGDLAKKSSESSTQNNSQKTGGSGKSS